jgi:FAD/FMN-containing dehydrogenase
MTNRSFSPAADTLDEIARIVGDKGVIKGDDAAPMLTEWRNRWPGDASLIIAPANVEEVAAVVKVCAHTKTPITPQGGNTGLVGGQMPTRGEVLVSMRRLNRIRDVSPLDNSMTLEAGVTLAAAQEAAEKSDRLFPLSIGSEGTCQIGGVISTNAGGVNVLRYGNTRDLVLGLEAVLPNGEIWNGLKRLRKDNTGYDLKQLFIGGEGTLGLVTAASLKLYPRPIEQLTAFVALASPEKALQLLSLAQAGPGDVTSFELISRDALALVLKNIPQTRAPLADDPPWYVLVEFSSGEKNALGGPVETMFAHALDDELITDATIAQNEREAHDFWRLRHSMSEAMRSEGAQAKFDVSTPVASVPAFLADADKAVNAACDNARIIAFGHMGDGNIHYDILQPDGMSLNDFDDARRRIEDAVYDVIAKYDGSISAEHGVGIMKAGEIALRKQPAEIAMMRAIKRALDPDNIMNPGKLVDTE